MWKKLAIGTGGAVATVAVGAVLFGTAFASGPGPNSDTAIGGRDVPLAVASELTGLSQDELLAELEGGTTIPALLEEYGVDLSVFHQAVADERQSALDEAVADGQISPEQGQWMEQQMTQNQLSAGPHGPGDCDGSGPMASGAAAGYGQPSDGLGPGLQNRWGADAR
jgi:hypothetical protein